MKQFLLSSMIVLIYSLQSFSQAGSLDNSFSSNGKVTLLVGKTSSVANASAIQSNGKILVAGSLYSALHKNNDFLIVRFNTDGTLDKSFASTGARGIDLSGDDEARSIIIQPDGKIIVVGNSYQFIDAARLKTNGTLDSSFGTNGKALIAFDGKISAAAIQQDGKIVMAGSWQTEINHEVEFALIRLHSDGTLDNTFGTNGEVFTDFEGGVDYAESVAVQSDGKIVAGGLTQNSNNRDVFAIARYNSNGILDASFGGDGKVTTSVGNSESVGRAVAIQSNGKILQAGDYYSQANGGHAFAVVRYNSNGTLDNSFAGNGKASIFFGGDDETAKSIVVQTNGKIIVAGDNGNVDESYDVAVTRLNSNGTRDNTFGSSGKVITDFGGDDYGLSAAIEPDGKIVVAGSRDNNRVIVARYLATGSSLTASSETITTEVKSASITSLAQNFPNPFSNSTTINYSLPAKFSSAKIIIADKNGNALKQINLSNNKGSVNIDVAMLSSGAYQYSLYVDGKLIVSKQMLISK